MERGFIKLWRKSQDSQVFQNAELWKVWTWCLMRANHKQNWVTIKTGRGETEVRVDPGQFIFGRKAAAKELKMPESSIWKRMKKLKNIENVNIKSDSKYSIVSIVNWEAYNSDEQKGDSKGDKQVTSKEQARNTEKNDKNYKNDKNKEKIYKKEKSSNNKIKFAEYVLMTNEEMVKLTKRYGESRSNKMIEVLDNYMGANPKKRRYESHYRAILSWVAGKVLEEMPMEGEGHEDIYNRLIRESKEADALVQQEGPNPGST